MKHFRYGIRKEDLLAAWLKRNRWTPYYRTGSRGAHDLEATRGNRRILIQMKSTRQYLTGEADARAHTISSFSYAAQSRLTRAANLRRATPLVAVSSGNYFWVFDPRQGGYALLHDGWLPRRPLRRN